MKEIGGYFELELRKGKEYHTNALRLNSGENCLEFLLKAKEFTKIYIPYYTCEIILKKCKIVGLDYEFYSIDQKLDPVFKREVKLTEAFLYTNYFGIKENTVWELAKKYKNLIIDNAQAFFSGPIVGVDSFYSARKFFGVPDGAYLYTDRQPGNLTRDNSTGRISHLIKRIDEGAEAGYPDFIENERSLSMQPLKSMSAVTHKLLCNIDYKEVIKIRKRNFLFLYKQLAKSNMLSISEKNDFVPMVYPYLSEKSGLRDYLISNKVYVAKYWPNVQDWVKNDTVEYFITSRMVPLPIDQRYNLRDMERIVSKVLEYV
jgi:hypothetical protein